MYGRFSGMSMNCDMFHDPQSSHSNLQEVSSDHGTVDTMHARAGPTLIMEPSSKHNPTHMGCRSTDDECLNPWILAASCVELCRGGGTGTQPPNEAKTLRDP
ncbi:unnamed protein product [Somion occarium]|uniref:Uncharacterized protein n=1 Tax=Somion occarium TaxID=3059160 RepID=A0ABP1D717_9APHY